MRKLKKLTFQKVYDLQNSSRTKFYKNILSPNININKWSSSETTLPKDRTKKDFDKNPVLDRFAHQLKNSGLKTTLTFLNVLFNLSVVPGGTVDLITAM